MAIQLSLVEAPLPTRGRVANIDVELMEQLNEMIARASATKPLSTGESFGTKSEATKAASKLARQLDKFRDDPKKRVATRIFVPGKPATEWADSENWNFGLYLADPRKSK